jgi:protein-glucosylgalactosylhydroxylysine glucosidase
LILGRETTPACCPEVVMYQHHIVADINYAVSRQCNHLSIHILTILFFLQLMQHLSATNDMEWFREKGCTFAEMTAQFWESRVHLNEDDGFYDIKSKKIYFS